MTTLNIASADQMRSLGRSLSPLLRAGDIIVLSGALGAGKTTFVQGLGEGLGIQGLVTSPTFVVARTHQAGDSGLGLIHVDAYRLASADDLADLDIDDERPHVTVIEWGEPFISTLTDSWLSVMIERSSLSDDDSPENGIRRVTIAPQGPAWQGRSVEVSP